MAKIVAWVIGVCLALGGSAQAGDQAEFTLAYDSFAPYIWSDEGVARGVYVDILTEALEERLDISVTFEAYPWRRAQRSVERGEADGMITWPTETRLQYTKSSTVPLVVAEVGLFTNEDHPRFEEMKGIKDLSGIEGYSILTYLGDGWAETALRDHQVDFDGHDFPHVLNKLAFRRGDVFVQTVETTLYSIEKLGLQDDLVRVPDVILDTLEFRLLIGKDSPFSKRLPEIDAVLGDMRDEGTIDAIRGRYR